MNETEIENTVELLTFIGQVIGNKERFRTEIKEQLGISIPKSFSYGQMLNLILNRGLEKGFCEAFLSRTFGTDNFKESYDKYTVACGLSLLDKNEVTCLAERVSNHGAKWKYDRHNKVNMMNDILARAGWSEIESGLVNAMAMGEIGPFVRQSKKWIIGPLGVCHSVESRGSEVNDLVDILDKYIGDKGIDSFLEKDTLLKKEFQVGKDDHLRLMKFIQNLLALRRTSDILNIFNALIGDGIIEVPTVDLETLFRFVVTPCGIFEKEYGGTDKLCRLLLQEIDAASLEQSLGTRYKTSSLELRVLDKCIRENPDDILLELFGRPQLLKIGINLGLVKIQELNNIELAKLIVMRLGFTLPPHLEGLAALIKKVTDGRKKIFNPAVDESTKRGIAVEALQGIEHVLKELVYFYVAFLWEDEVSNLYGADEIRNKINEIIKREFKMARSGGLAKFTLGMLVDLFRKANSRVASDSGLRQRVHTCFKRQPPVSGEAINLISKANAVSPQIKHADESRSAAVLDFVSCDNFLANIIEALNILRAEGSCPKVVRVRREVRDEYDRSYIIAVDDEGEEWTVKSDTWLQPEKAYFMYSETSPVAVSPFIVEKIF